MIIYLHGFNSAPASHKARSMAEYMKERGLEGEIYCPELPHRPADAIALAAAELAKHDPQEVTLVGSSLGGFYATYLAEKHGWKAVLVNPAVHVQTLLRDALGTQTNWHTGEKWVLTEAHLAELAALDVARITHPERYLLLLQTGDEVLDYLSAESYYVGARQVIESGGDHGFAGFERHFQSILDF